MSLEILIEFLKRLQSCYYNNPYHNKTHGAQVAHHAICLASMLKIRLENSKGFSFLSTNDALSSTMGEFAFVIAALAHDVGHPGVTNLFLINSFSVLAMTYNDISVLENYHASKLFYIAKEPQAAIFAELSEDSYTEMRKKIIELILATDMAKHFEELSMLRQKQVDPDFSPQSNPQDGWLLAKFCIKGADIGNKVDYKIFIYINLFKIFIGLN